MFFTQEDFKKIEKWLSQNAVKDTEFNEAVLPLNGNEEITIIQGNHNKKVSLKDLVNNIKLLGNFDFINVSESFNAKYISLQNAISLIPHRGRKIGQVITFLGTDGNWGIYQFKGESLEVWNNITLWINIIESLHIDSILPDEEDLTITTPDVQGNVKMKFKDKDYNPLDFSGLGKIYLRKNITTIIDTDNNIAKDINLLTQQAFSKENTIYIIQYDYDLNGESITIPKGCVLDFQGGSIVNGTLIGRSTTINAPIRKIFDINISISGSWNSLYCYPEWFGICGDGDDSPYIQKAINTSIIFKSPVKLAGTKYTINNSLVLKSYVAIEGNIKRNTTLYGTVDIIKWNSFVEEVIITNIDFDGNDICAISSDTKVYLSTFIISNCNFRLSLKRAFYGSAILGTIKNCTFGYYGSVTSNPEHSFIHFVGDAGNVATNINKIINNKFYRSTGNYACVFEGGYQLLISGCTFEQNSNSIATILFSGMSIFNMTDNWIEQNHSNNFIRLQNYQDDQQTVGNYIVRFTNNMVYSATECKVFIENYGGSAIRYISITYNEIVALYNNLLTKVHDQDNWVSEHFGNNYVNCSNIPNDKLPVAVPKPAISSKGLIKDPWFQEWSTSSTLWGKLTASTLSSYTESTVPTPYDKGIRIQGGNSHNGIYTKLPAPLLRGKRIVIKALVKITATAGGDQWSIGVSSNTAPSSLSKVGSTVSTVSDNYVTLKATYDIPTTMDNLSVGLYCGGIISTLQVKAFDVWIVDNSIEPEFSI